MRYYEFLADPGSVMFAVSACPHLTAAVRTNTRKGRLIRLVPEEGVNANGELLAIKRLLNHRLKPSHREAREEWLEIVEGSHELWKGVCGLLPVHPRQ